MILTPPKLAARIRQIAKDLYTTENEFEDGAVIILDDAVPERYDGDGDPDEAGYWIAARVWVADSAARPTDKTFCAVVVLMTDGRIHTVKFALPVGHLEGLDESSMLKLAEMALTGDGLRMDDIVQLPGEPHVRLRSSIDKATRDADVRRTVARLQRLNTMDAR